VQDRQRGIGLALTMPRRHRSTVRSTTCPPR